MFRSIFYLAVILIFFFHLTCSSKAEEAGVSHLAGIQKITNDTLLDNAQKKIYDSFINSIVSKTASPLEELQGSLEELYQQHQLNIIQYWRGYLQYYLAIYHLKSGAKNASEKEVDKGITLIDGMKRKNSEDYALLAHLESFSTQFKGIKAATIAGKIQRHGKLAISMDSTNLRGYYVLGSSDFYTPKKFGGGKMVEKHLTKAIQLPAQTVENGFLPSWGKEESYELLIKYYIREEKWEEAVKYYQEGIALFPNNYQLSSLASKLVGK